MNMPVLNNYQINERLLSFINEHVLPKTNLDEQTFWSGFVELIEKHSGTNAALLRDREQLQQKLNQFYEQHAEGYTKEQYLAFLKLIGYIEADIQDFTITTHGVDKEIAEVAGPQLVVPVDNARFALNAANARWGSLYDVLYGTNVIPEEAGLKKGQSYNRARGKHVVAYARELLDDIFPLNHGSHHDVTSYLVYYQHLLACFEDGSTSGLASPKQFVGFGGSKSEPDALLLRNHGLHVEIQINRNGPNGKTDLAGIDDIIIESALTCIMDFEDSVAAVDAEDKVNAYGNWLGLIEGDLSVSFDKGGETVERTLNVEKLFTDKNGDNLLMKSQALMMARNVGLHMYTDMILDRQGNQVPEGIIDSVITALIGSLDLNKRRNSREGSIYIVKPKLHGSKEVAFCNELFGDVEALLGLPMNTLKMGIMDEERRTTVNLKQCIHAARERVVFINTGFLDRTGDEIHTSMYAGAFLPKELIKKEPWIKAYEQWNVDMGLKTGFKGRAQIGKGMWPKPDEMAEMMVEKVNHLLSGANTAWVPSPSAAVLHALHYHKVSVPAVQETLRKRTTAELSEILMLPLQKEPLSQEVIEHEVKENLQGILGYIVRWVELGIGCSKVPDLNQVGLMEDRATLRISSQLIANWLMHGVTNKEQVERLMLEMAELVDEQNAGVKGYKPMSQNPEESLAFQAAKTLIFKGIEQPAGYTEPVLSSFRIQAKANA